jgi:hypothetical protein
MLLLPLLPLDKGTQLDVSAKADPLLGSIAAKIPNTRNATAARERRVNIDILTLPPETKFG